MSSLVSLRRRGMRLLVGMGWLCIPSLLILGHALSSPNIGFAVAVAAAANVVPTMMVLRRRHDAAARMSVAALGAVLPACFVYMLAGNAWQMDAHMYFFVALSMLAVLCDWRPLALASVLVALHHFSLSFLMPAWVFGTDRTMGRVLFHAFAVALQFAALGYLTVRLRTLIVGLDAARAEGEQLVAVAEEERRRAIDALASAKVAEERSADERRRRVAAEARLDDERRHALAALADEFEQTVAGVAVAIEGAASSMEVSAANLTRIAADAGRQASEVAAGASQAAGATQDVADAVHRLTGSIVGISGSAEAQATLTSSVRRHTDEGKGAVLDLSVQAQSIGGLVGEIHAIAARTNLLALNATIEAARAGDAGRGFTVVAGEVKQLAGGTARATEKIVALMQGVEQAIRATEANIVEASDGVGRVATAASDIRGAVSDQRLMAATIERTSQEAARGVDMIERRIVEVATAANEVGALSRHVRDAADALSDQARRLRVTTDGFVQQLRSGDTAAPHSLTAKVAA